MKKRACTGKTEWVTGQPPPTCTRFFVRPPGPPGPHWGSREVIAAKKRNRDRVRWARPRFFDPAVGQPHTSQSSHTHLTSSLHLTQTPVGRDALIPPPPPPHHVYRSASPDGPRGPVGAGVLDGPPPVHRPAAASLRTSPQTGAAIRIPRPRTSTLHTGVWTGARPAGGVPFARAKGTENTPVFPWTPIRRSDSNGPKGAVGDLPQDTNGAGWVAMGTHRTGYDLAFHAPYDAQRGVPDPPD